MLIFLYFANFPLFRYRAKMSIKINFSQIDTSPRNIYRLLRHYKNIVFFLCGFLFDAITITRIDAFSDISIQIFYLLFLSFLLIYQYRENKGIWTPGKWVSKVWSYNVEILHFLYGGLLSAYVILYLKSTSGARTFFFLFLMALLLIINEMPQVRRFGYRLRLSLYAFCVSSFLIYFIAIVVGRIGTGVFYLSISLSVLIVWFVAGALVSKEANKSKAQIRLFLPATGLFLIIVLLYHFRLIPPVPLSIQYQGIFHHILKSGDNYRLRYTKPPFYAFWRKDSRPFLALDDDSIYYFARVFAPTRFKTKVHVRWELFNEKKGEYVTTDIIPMEISGGRAKGFRGYVSKSNFSLGKWRVSTETEDGRIIGYVKMKVLKQDPKSKRVWIDLIM